MTEPLVKGGQGRSSDACERSAWLVFWSVVICCALALCGLL